MMMEEFCFVIMPFDPKFYKVYTNVIKPAVESQRLKCVRADDVDKTGNIVKRIVEYIAKAKIIIADLTDKKANVFYELGIAHSIGNKCIVIAQSATDIPFDVQAYQALIYENSIGGGYDLHDNIISYIKTFDDWSARSNNPVQDFLPDKLISFGQYENLAGELETIKTKLDITYKDLQEYEMLKQNYNELNQKYIDACEKAKELEILHKLLGPLFTDGRKPSHEQVPEFISSIRKVVERVQEEGEVSIDVVSNENDGKKNRIKFTKINKSN